MYVCNTETLLYSNDFLNAVEILQPPHELPDHIVEPRAESAAGDHRSRDCPRVEVGCRPNIMLHVFITISRMTREFMYCMHSWMKLKNT